jgi:ankyrin repeat protein
MHAAASGGFLDIIEYLERRGADIHIKDNSNKDPLAYAKQNRRTVVIKYLQDKVDVHVLKTILESGIDILHMKGNNGVSPTIHTAAMGGQKETLKYLLDHGADINEPADVSYAVVL